MSEKKRSRRAKKMRLEPPGSSPGTLTENPEAPQPTLRLLAYGPGGYEEVRLKSADEARPYLGRFPVIWLDVDALGSLATIRAVGELFALHPLALEDVAQVHQRAKVEAYGEYDYIVARMVEHTDPVETEQLSIFLGQGYVVTFQERPGDCFEPIRERIRRGQGRLRSVGPDYLVYALLDSIIDAYYPVLEAYGESLEDLESEALWRPDRRTVGRIHSIKRDLLALRRAVWPLREALNVLQREESSRMAAETRIYLRDGYDHVVQLIDLLETYRELGSELTDLYLSSLSNRMNEVMKVLTVISTIFIPLTFIAGIYGMNFDPQRSPWNMPELEWKYGYPFVMGLMALVAGVLIVFFKRKGWIFSKSAGLEADARDEAARAESEARTAPVETVASPHTGSHP